jgi:hypothetical protein
MSDRGLAGRLRDLGIPSVKGRIVALRQLVLEVPAPVAAHALGFHHATTHRQTTTLAAPGTATSPPEPERACEARLVSNLSPCPAVLTH